MYQGTIPRVPSNGPSSIYTPSILTIVWLVVPNIFYVQPDPWGNDPIWRAYFLNGLKPPTLIYAFTYAYIYLYEIFNSFWKQHTKRYPKIQTWVRVSIINWWGSPGSVLCAIGVVRVFLGENNDTSYQCWNFPLLTGWGYENVLNEIVRIHSRMIQPMKSSSWNPNMKVDGRWLSFSMCWCSGSMLAFWGSI